MGSCPSLEECKDYIKNIIPDTMIVLDQASVNYRCCNGNTEIVLSNSEKTVDEIRDLIESSLEIPKIITSMLLDIKTGGANIFIRLRYK